MSIQSLLKTSLATLFILICLTSASAQSDQIRNFQFEAKKGSQTVKVIFQTRPFDQSKHKVFIDKTNQIIVDGRQALGTDASIPISETSSVKLYINGKEIRVPRKFYSDCFDLQLNDANFIKVAFSASSKSIIVEMRGADAAATYHVTWWFRKSGRHTRDVSQDFNFKEDSKDW